MSNLRSVPPSTAADPWPASPKGPVRERAARGAGEPRDGGSALVAYFRDVRRHPVLSREEEHRIATAFTQTRDPRLAARLVEANLRLVVKLALEYRMARPQLLDLVQEGNLGLVHAVQKYDPGRGIRLATYASWWMRAYMLKYILSCARLVKLGTTQTQRRLFFGLRRERARLEGLGGAAVDARRLAARLDASEHDVEEMERRLAAAESSLDELTHSSGAGRSCGDAFALEDASRPDLQCETAEFNEAFIRSVRAFRGSLTGRDVVIFDGRLASEDATTFAEIAARFGVSRERVRQLEGELKRRLRRHLAATLGDAVPVEAAAA